jgi:hypothetical protein
MRYEGGLLSLRGLLGEESVDTSLAFGSDLGTRETSLGQPFASFEALEDPFEFRVSHLLNNHSYG